MAEAEFRTGDQTLPGNGRPFRFCIPPGPVDRLSAGGAGRQLTKQSVAGSAGAASPGGPSGDE
jgi:hypothetical protein